jgi:hypothetical protein
VPHIVLHHMTQKKISSLITLLISTLVALAQPKPGYNILKVEPLNMQRVEEIAAMLPEAPKGFGDPIEKREVWNKLYQSGKFKIYLKEADSISKTPFPHLTDEIYMNYYKGKDSETSKRFVMKRRFLLTKMVWAECLTNQGKYMPYILAGVTDILATPSWTFPAEDLKNTNYEGTNYTIGLSSSAYANDMAQVLYLLRSKLNKQMQQQITEELYKKIYRPTLNALKNNNANGEFTWLGNSGNHVCATLDGVIGSALAVIRDKKERAAFVAIGERYSYNYLVGYTNDGYCSEGIGYYSYGFGHYLQLREAIWQATGGKIDLLKRPKIDKIVAFAPGMEIINGVYAAIGDCEQYIKPYAEVMYYLNQNYNMDIKEYNNLLASDIAQVSIGNVMYFFPNSTTVAKPLATVKVEQGVRHYFKDVGVLTVRPDANSGFRMGATFKGGNNAEHHNHNDIGSFTIAIGNELIMGDAGLAVYTPKYFGTERYKLFKTAASYGHDVPLIAGVQQSTGKQAQAKITSTEFNADKDVMVMDISSGYEVPSLKKLVRTFTYNRTVNGSIQVQDSYAFDSPQSFETALITRYKWKQLGSNDIEITGKKEKLLVHIDAPANSLIFSSEEITETAKPYTRIAIKLKETVKDGTVTMTFEPGK